MGSVSIEDGGLEHMSSQVSGELVRTRTRVPGKGKVLTYALDQGGLGVKVSGADGLGKHSQGPHLVTP